VSKTSTVFLAIAGALLVVGIVFTCFDSTGAIIALGFSVLAAIRAMIGILRTKIEPPPRPLNGVRLTHEYIDQTTNARRAANWGAWTQPRNAPTLQDEAEMRDRFPPRAVSSPNLSSPSPRTVVQSTSDESPEGR